jgi:hypothetical protein
VFQFVDFSSTNDLKFTYVRLKIQKNFRGLYPRTPIIRGGKGKEGRGKEGKEGEGRGGKGREGKGGMGWVNPPPPNENPGYGPVRG